MLKMLPPDEAKRKARANLAAWKREKERFAAECRKKLNREFLDYAKNPMEPSMTMRFLSQGVNVNAKDKDGDTPLMLAAGRGEIWAVKLLLENGADVKARNKMGMTALDNAIRQDNKRTAVLLARELDRIGWGI